MVGEFVGTTLFLLLALGATNVANIPTTSVTGATAEGEKGTTVAAVNTSSLLYIALAFGFSLAVNAWIFFRVSGGLFNPAVSFGMALVGALTPLRACLLTFAQILGGITGMSRRTRIPRVTHTGRSNRRRYRRCYHSGNVECSNTIGRRNNCGQRTVYRNVHDVDAHDYHVSICMRRILCPILISTPIVVCCLLLKSTRQPSSRQLVSGELPITWTVTQLTHSRSHLDWHCSLQNSCLSSTSSFVAFATTNLTDWKCRLTATLVARSIPLDHSDRVSLFMNLTATTGFTGLAPSWVPLWLLDSTSLSRYVLTIALPSLRALNLRLFQYLEYETVLGPEADEDKPKNMNQAGQGVPALTGGAVPAQSMITPTSAPDTTGKTTLATQGAGLGDLLTHGPAATSDVCDPKSRWHARYLDLVDCSYPLLYVSGFRPGSQHRCTLR